MLKKIFFVLCFVLISSTSFATWTASGCVSDDTGYLYTGVAYGTTFETTPVVYEVGTGIYCSPTVNGTCRIRTKSQCRDCTTRPDSNGWYYQSGQMTYYMACPIDDYIPLILIGVAGVGFFAIRKGLIF